jgi:hypothetical protein
LDNKFDRAAMIIKEGQGEKVAEQVQKFIMLKDTFNNVSYSVEHGDQF